MSTSTTNMVDAVMRTCGVVIPQETLELMIPKAEEILEPYGCSNDESAVKIMAYLLLLPNRETTQPCITKLNQLFTIFCPEVFDDLIF